MVLMKGTVRFFLVFAILFIAFGSAVLLVDKTNSGDSVVISKVQAKSADEESNYNLSSIVILTRVISYIKNYYYDPQRINPEEMLKGSLEEVARSIPSVMVDFDDLKKVVVVRVDTETREFSFVNTNTVWKIQYRISEIFRFIQPYLEKSINPKDVEYAAINGMLDTLDPHSVHLSPKFYRELKMSTVGNFGGIGIQIGIRDGKLTVIAPIMDTPAWRAGIKAKDKVMKIDGQSTINMSLDEAVSLMRGEKGTKVKLSIERKGWTEYKDFELVRDTIPIRSVYSKLLPGRIGYVKVTNFQGNTVGDLKKALKDMKKRGDLQGLILDLRSNPGGLLDQSIKMSDLFLDSGTIVTTVGAGNERLEVNEASFLGTEEKYPMLVLIGRSSASASEIVSGALKNNNRAVLIGERTFGKGSVQVIYDMDDGSALKLTVAQYLTPGDVSIQSVGVVPDIELLPVYIDKGRVEFYSYENRRAEKDLDHHLDNQGTIKDKSFESMHYLYDEKRDEIDIDAPPDQVHTEDYSTQFAYKLLKHLGNISRREIILQRSVNYLKEADTTENEKLIKRFAKFNINWKDDKIKQHTEARIDIHSNLKGAIPAGSDLKLTVKVTNTGKVPFVRLRAITESDNPYFDGLEFFVGRIEPGKSESYTANVSIPKDMPSRADDVVFKFFSTNEKAPGNITKVFEIESEKLPEFAYTFSLNDEKGNGDGCLQRGESIDINLEIENIGNGEVIEGLAILKNVDNIKEVFINAGRVKFDPIKPGKRAKVTFSFHIDKSLEKSEFPMEIMIMDTDLRVYLMDQVNFMIKPEMPITKAKPNQVVEILAETPVFGCPDQSMPQIAKTSKKTGLKLVAISGNWAKVDIGKKQYGWVFSNAAWKPKNSKKSSGLSMTMFRKLPRIILSKDSEKLYSNDKIVKIEGEIKDDNHIQDVYILRNGKKVYFKSNKTATNPLKMNFSALIELEEGSNMITIFARENEDFVGRKSIFVYRKKSEQTD